MYRDKTYIIIGGLGLIGAEFSKHILENNGNVVVADIPSVKRQLLKSFRKNKNFYFFPCDVSDDIAIEKLLNFAKKKFKLIDGAIYCAYPKSNKWGTKFEKLERKFLNIDINYNLTSPIIFSKKILKIFLNQKYGNLVFLSSVQGISSPKFHHYENTNMSSPIEYSAIKSGIIAITKYLAKMYSKKPIRINCISPGGILDDQPKSFQLKYKRDCGNKGLLDPKDLVGSLSFILDDKNKFLNGQNIIVDDGWSL